MPVIVASRRAHRGAVLVLAMVFLLLLAMLATGALQRGLLAVRMAGNEQAREAALEKVRSVLDALALETGNFPLNAGLGYTLCQRGDVRAACQGELLPLPAGAGEREPGAQLLYQVTREGPLWLGHLPLRLPESEASSGRVFGAALFEGQARVDGTDVRQGRAQAAQGYLVLGPRPQG